MEIFVRIVSFALVCFRLESVPSLESVLSLFLLILVLLLILQMSTPSQTYMVFLMVLVVVHRIFLPQPGLSIHPLTS